MYLESIPDNPIPHDNHATVPDVTLTPLGCEPYVYAV